MRMLRSRHRSACSAFPRPRGRPTRRSSRGSFRSAPCARPRVLRRPSRFDLVGLHWQGSGRVLFRTRTLAGRWSAWQPAAPEEEDRPDPGSAEARPRRGWRLGSPYWVGSSDRIDYRVVGDVRRLRAWFVWSPVGRSVARDHGDGGLAADRAAPVVEGRRGDPPEGAALREGRSLCGRPPHGRLERLLARRLGGDRQGDRAVPRARQRLERHRLQLPGRQVRPDLRGPLRRGRSQRDRRARRGLQHRFGRDRRDRQLRCDDDHARGARLPSLRCSPGGSTSRMSTRSAS